LQSASAAAHRQGGSLLFTKRVSKEESPIIIVIPIYFRSPKQKK